MKNLLEYTIEIAFLNTLLKKEMINENEYKDIKNKIKAIYSVDKKMLNNIIRNRKGGNKIYIFFQLDLEEI